MVLQPHMRRWSTILSLPTPLLAFYSLIMRKCVSSAYAIYFTFFLNNRLFFCLEYLSTFLSPDNFTDDLRLNVFLWEAFQGLQVEQVSPLFCYTNSQRKLPCATYGIYYLWQFLPSHSDSRRQELCSFPLTPQWPCIVLRRDTEIVKMTSKALSNPCHLFSSGLCRCCSVWNASPNLPLHLLLPKHWHTHFFSLLS